MNFCTHFDENYLPHGLSLLDSLNQHLNDFTLFVVCMDEVTLNYFKKHNPKNCKYFSINTLESTIKGLKKVKQTRNKVEYFFTCSPAICKLIIELFPNIDSITYLDADLYFFSSPDSLFVEMEGSSIGIIEHRFHWTTLHQKKFGIYNVGWVTFKNDQEGTKCLNNWLEDCLEWCYQKVESKRFGDQKYLNEWPQKYTRVCVIQHLGANVAIWNIKNYKLTYFQNQVYVNDYPLLFYHFSGLKELNRNNFNTNLSRVFVSTKGVIKNHIYEPYLKNLIDHRLESKIIPKRDNHISGFTKLITELSRKIRSLAYNDIINIQTEDL